MPNESAQRPLIKSCYIWISWTLYWVLYATSFQQGSLGMGNSRDSITVFPNTSLAQGSLGMMRNCQLCLRRQPSRKSCFAGGSRGMADNEGNHVLIKAFASRNHFIPSLLPSPSGHALWLGVPIISLLLSSKAPQRERESASTCELFNQAFFLN